MFGTLNGLILHLLTYQPIYQVQYLPLFLYTKLCKSNIISLTFDATLLNCNTRFTDRAENISLNFTFNNTPENLNGTRNLTQLDIQIPSHFMKGKQLKQCLQQHNKASLTFIILLLHHMKILHSHRQLSNQQ